MFQSRQRLLFTPECGEVEERNTTTFVDNMRLPVHRWFRFSAGFSAQWAESVIANAHATNPETRVLDPFAGSGTTLISAENVGVPSYGVESHPFVARVAQAKLAHRSSAAQYRTFATAVLKSAKHRNGTCDEYPALIRSCYLDDALADLDRLRAAYESQKDDSPASELTWLTLLSILRKTSHVGTANWQYVLPKKRKAKTDQPFDAFADQIEVVYRDMRLSRGFDDVSAELLRTDARTCDGVPTNFANLVITSPPYPNNFDYADATRLEMTFMREIDGWGDLQAAVRQHLVRSCSQHVPERAVKLPEILASPELSPIRSEISAVCEELSEIRMSKGGRKTYHLMIACYFLDLAKVWIALRRACDTPSQVCFVVGDSAPYGVYVPVMDWLGRLAVNAGFSDFRFDKLRDRNIKWKNRKHRVPLSEGRLWING